MDTKEISDFFDTDLASCKGVDVTVFYPAFPRGNWHNGQKQEMSAKLICQECVVKKGCLEYSLRFEPLGVWGGKSEMEREILRRKHNISLPEGRKASHYVQRSVRTGRIKRTERKLSLLDLGDE